MPTRLAQPFRKWQPLVFALTILIGGHAHAHSLDIVSRVNALENTDFPRTILLVGDLPDDVDEETWDAAITASVAAWNAVPCSNAVLSYGGRVDDPPLQNKTATTIAFVDPTEERCFPAPNELGWTNAAECGPWGPGSVLLNATDYNWRATPDPYQAADDRVVDIESVLTHELGHVLGIRHADVSSALATMAPRYLLDGGLRTLSAQDELALCALFPSGDSECARDADCAPGHACVVDGAVGVCDEFRADVGDYCDLGALDCEDGCIVTSAATFSGYCTAVCETDADCPSDMFCDETACLLTPGPTLEPSGCSTSRGSASLLLPLWTLALFAMGSRRRSSRSARRQT